MDFRVTHFLVADGVSSQTTLAALENTKLAAFKSDGTDMNLDGITSGTAGTPGITGPYQLVQGLDRTDAIQKELGVIKSGILDPSKIVSVRKIVGTDDYSRQLKFFGASTTGVVVKNFNTSTSTAYLTGDIIFVVATNRLYLVINGGTGVAGTTAPTSTTGEIVAVGSNGTKMAYIGTGVASTQYSKMEVTGATGSTTAGTLEFEANKEYSFSVRVRSAQANTISPFGITRGYAATASNVFVNTVSGASTTSNAFAPFSALFGLVKNFSTDVMLADFAKVGGVLSVSDSIDTSVYVLGYSDLVSTVTANAATGIPTDGISTYVLSNLPTHLSLPDVKGNGGIFFIDVRKFATWNDALTACTNQTQQTFTNPYPKQATVVAGQSYTATLYTEGLTQTAWKNNYDITAFPYKWDYARLNGFFYEGPYGNASFVTNNNVVLPINAGVSTQTPIVYDSTQSGLVSIGTIAINPITVTTNPVPAGYVVMTSAGVITTEVKFPNLMKEEVRHIAHQYQSYSSKYKQQFKGVRYNAMVVDPQQEKITANGPYTLYYIEYLPSVDVSYTSTQQMTNLTIIATADSTLITQLDYALYGAAFASSTDGKYVLETAS
jgi:hypothetical protein